MEPGTDPRAIIEALAKHEEALSALYAAFADAYPQVEGLWRTLSHEEHGHARLLRSLADKREDLQSFIDARRFDVDAVTAETTKITSIIKAVPSGAIPLQEAFRVALKFEDGMIDGQIFMVTVDDTPAVAKVLGALEAQTKRHRAHLRESLATLPSTS